jgi:hypothetical protein
MEILGKPDISTSFNKVCVATDINIQSQSLKNMQLWRHTVQNWPRQPNASTGTGRAPKSFEWTNNILSHFTANKYQVFKLWRYKYACKSEQAQI